MSYTISDIRLDELHLYWQDPAQSLDWPHPFVIPAWLEAWWSSFGKGNTPYLKAVRDDNDIIGIAPLMVSGSSLGFMGSTDVCDYQDFIIRPGCETGFFHGLFQVINADGLNHLVLRHVRPDSYVMNALRQYTDELQCRFTSVEEDTTVEMQLPSDFERYLGALTSKQRHEVRRKMRRVYEAGNVTYRVLDDINQIRPVLDSFFSMFRESRNDKDAFLTPEMKEFFLVLTEKLGSAGILRLGVLELDDIQVASIIFFDYGDCRYLYNCGYDPNYTGLSVGLVSKVMTIKDSIENHMKHFDFLKGNETYKYHLGGRDVPLSSCTIELT